MLQLAWGLCLTALLGWDSAVLAAKFRRPAAVFPLPLLCAAALLVYAGALPGFLRAGVWGGVGALGALAVWGALRLGRESVRQLTESSGLMLFLGGATCVLIMLETNMSITMCVVGVIFIMLFASGAKVKHLVLLLLPVIAGAVVLIVVEP